MDQQLAELKASIERYKADTRAPGPVGVLDWTALLVILPAVLSLFIKDGPLREVIMQIIKLLTGIFQEDAE